MTMAERKVWSILRMGQMNGFRFRRQVPIGHYIVDFACHDARLVIEIDGGQHDLESPDEIRRTRFIEREGYRVIRFWNNDVLSNLEGVYGVIIGALAQRHPHLTSPIEGEGHESILPVPSPSMGESLPRT
jgi:very-short-patch-repair endonuclease